MIRGDKPIKVITNNVIRQLGDVYKFNLLGIRLERFLDKATLLKNHNYDDNVGLWDLESMKITPEYIEMVPLFSETEPEMAKKYEEGLYAASISVELNTDDIQDTGDGMYIINGCELIEVSLVSVPADGKAIKNKFSYKNHKDKKISNIMKFMLNNNENNTDTIEDADEVIDTEVSKDVNDVLTDVSFSKEIEKVEEIKTEDESLNEIETKEVETVDFQKIIDELNQKIDELTKILNEKDETVKEYSAKIESFELKLKTEKELKEKSELNDILDEYNVEVSKREIYFSLGIEKTKEILLSLPVQAKKSKNITKSGVVEFLKQNTENDIDVDYDYEHYLSKGSAGIKELSKIQSEDRLKFDRMYEAYALKLKNKKIK